MNDGRKGRVRGARTGIDRFVIGMASAGIAGVVFAATLAGQTPRAAAPPADLNQLMRGLFFPHSNVVFAPQRVNPADIKRASEPSTATDPLAGVFGNWEAVENSALTLTEAADLLMTPGRKCSNGKDVPLTSPEWVRMVNKLREAGMFSFKAAQSKNIDKMLEAADVLNDSCAECHNRYRPRNIANRCQ